MIESLLILVIVGAAVYYSFNRPKSNKKGSSFTSTPSVFPPFGEPGEYSFQPRDFEGSQYVWKEGKWYKTN